MAELQNGDVVLGTNNANILRLRFKGGKWFKQGAPCRPPYTNSVPEGSLGDRISSLATLHDGDLVSGSSNGTIVRWQSPDNQWCKKPFPILDKESLPIFSMTELSDRTMISATEKGGLTMWKWGQPPSQTKEEIATIHWKDPGQQIASVAVLPKQRGLVVADFTGRSKIYPDRDEAIRLGCDALRQKFEAEKDHKNPGNQALKPYENEARIVCQKIINEKPKTSVGKN